MSCLSCIEPVIFSIFCNFKKNISIDLTYESRFQNNEVIIKQRPGFLIRLFKHFCQFFCHLFSVLGNETRWVVDFLFYCIVGCKLYSLDNSWIPFITGLILWTHDKHQSFQKVKRHATSIHFSAIQYTCTVFWLWKTCKRQNRWRFTLRTMFWLTTEWTTDMLYLLSLHQYHCIPTI